MEESSCFNCKWWLEREVTPKLLESGNWGKCLYATESRHNPQSFVIGPWSAYLATLDTFLCQVYEKKEDRGL